MSKVEKLRSSDGTEIAYERLGNGPAVVMTVGAFNDRNTAKPLAELLASQFSVYLYDRRGRGDSGDQAEYAIDREVEDLDAVIQHAGGSAAVFGYSSGGVLTLHALKRGVAITRFALYEPPLILDGSGPNRPADLPAQLADLVATGQRGKAVEVFQELGVGMPIELIAQIRQSPFRPYLESMAQTLVYEATITDDLTVIHAIKETTVPGLIIAGGESPEFLHRAADAIAAAVPNSDRRTLPGATHDLDPDRLAPILVDFFAQD